MSGAAAGIDRKLLLARVPSLGALASERGRQGCRNRQLAFRRS